MTTRSNRRSQGQRVPERQDAAEVVRRVRKPAAPPARVEQPAGGYDRSRRRQDVDEEIEEQLEDRS